jgi:hypothetical protein
MKNDIATKKDRFIPKSERMPYDEENKHLSKAAAVAKWRAQQERNAKLRAIESEMKAQDERKSDPVDAQSPVQSEEKKKPGRPKKVE